MGRQYGGATKILDGSVTTSKLADGAVTSEKIATNTITASNIASEAIEGSELNPDINSDGFVNTQIPSALYTQVNGSSGSQAIVEDITSWRGQTGANAFSAANLLTNNTWRMPDGTAETYCLKFRFRANMTATDTRWLLGFDTSGNANRIIIQKDTTETINQATLVTVAGGVSTISSAFGCTNNTWHTALFTITTSSVTLNLDGTDVASSTTNIPTTDMFIQLSVQNATTAANQVLDVDYWKVWSV